MHNSFGTKQINPLPNNICVRYLFLRMHMRP